MATQSCTHKETQQRKKVRFCATTCPCEARQEEEKTERTEREDPRPNEIEQEQSLNLFEIETMVATMEPDEPQEIDMDVTLDSGAGDHVADPDDAPGYDLQESPGSRMGQYFVGAGGERIANKGCMDLNLVAPNGSNRGTGLRSRFQAARVTRPLHSVSKICDEGHEVRFKKESATVLDEKGKVIAVYTRKGGLYVATMKLRPQSDHKAGSPVSFHRQGK